MSGINHLRVMLEAREMPLPFIGFPRLESFGRERTIHHGTDFAERTRGASGKNLHCYIAKRRGFGRSGQYATAGSIGGELVQQAILRTAADDANPVNWSLNQAFQIIDDLTIFEGETLKHSSHVRAGGFRTRLLRSRAESVNS